MKAQELLTLNEINMRPKSLRRAAEEVGATVGLEFEMIVSDVPDDDGDEGPQPDWDADESTRSIDQICRFFHDGDVNGRRAIQELREALEEDYRDWFYERESEEWEKVENDVITDAVKEEIDSLEIMSSYLVDNYGMSEPSALRLIRAGRNDELDEIDPRQLRLWAEHNYDYRSAWVEAVRALEQTIEDEVEEAIRRNNRTWERAQESWRETWTDDNWNDLQGDWLEATDRTRMTSILNEFGGYVSWPHYEDSSESEAAIADVAQNFGRALNRPVEWSNEYHGARRGPDNYAVEPDGSLKPDNYGERGIEFVSPPLPFEEALGDMAKVKRWAKNRGAYTNDSCGLHMNVSTPNYSRSALDYVKCALLLGDVHVLETFERLTNTYTNSAFEKIMSSPKIRNVDTVTRVFAMLNDRLSGIASRLIHNTYTDKYTSINVKDTHVEFRAPGGDWLGEMNVHLQDTLCRFIVVLDAACDPDKYREEYAKKLYKALAPSSEYSDIVQLFVQWAGGRGLHADHLRTVLQQRRGERAAQRGGNDDEGQQLWWWAVSRTDRPHFTIEVVGANRADAIRRAQATPGTDWADRSPGEFTARYTRPFGAPESTTQQDRPPQRWSVWVAGDFGGRVVVYADDTQQAVRVARTMHPQQFLSSIPNSEIRVVPAN